MRRSLVLIMMGSYMLTACAHTGAQRQAASKFRPKPQAYSDQAYLEAQLYTFSGNYKKAREVLEAHLSESPHQSTETDLNLRLMLSKLYAEDGKIEKALESYQKIHDDHPENLQVAEDMAKFYYKVGLKDEALEFYSFLTEKKPQISNHWIYKGLLALELGDTALAWDAFDYLSRESKDAKHLGFFYLGKLMQLTGNHVEAKKAYKKCLRINEDAKDCVLALSEQDYELNQKFLAVSRLRKFLKERDLRKNQNLIRRLAEWGVSDNQVDQALLDFETLERLNPGNLDIKRKISSILVNQKEMSRAEQRLKLIAQSQDAAEADVFNYVNVLVLQNQTEQATKFLDQLTERKKWTPALFFKAYDLHKKQKSSQQAIEHIAKICEATAVNKESCVYTHSYLLFKKGKARLAEKKLRRLLAKNTEKSSRIRYFLAQIYADQNKKKKAIREVEQSLREEKDFAPALNFKAYYFAEQNKNLDEARDLVVRALAKDPSNGHYLDTYGWILFKLESFSEAKVILQQAFKNLPGEPEIAEHLADVYRAINQKDKALKFYRLASGLYKGENQKRVGGKIAQIQKQQRGFSSFSGAQRQPASD